MLSTRLHATTAHRAHAPLHHNKSHHPAKKHAQHRDGCRPSLYVYRLPERYRDPTADGLPADGVGRPLRLREPGIARSCWDSEPHSVASLIYQRALAYRCRVHDAAAADLFLVPAFRTRGGPTVCAETGRRGNSSSHGHRILRQRLRIEMRRDRV